MKLSKVFFTTVTCILHNIKYIVVLLYIKPGNYFKCILSRRQ